MICSAKSTSRTSSCRSEYGCVRSIALMAVLTQGRNFLLRNVDKRTQEARDDLFGEEHESDFFLQIGIWLRPFHRFDGGVDAGPELSPPQRGQAHAGGAR